MNYTYCCSVMKYTLLGDLQEMGGSFDDEGVGDKAGLKHVVDKAAVEGGEGGGGEVDGRGGGGGGGGGGRGGGHDAEERERSSINYGDIPLANAVELAGVELSEGEDDE